MTLTPTKIVLICFFATLGVGLAIGLYRLLKWLVITYHDIKQFDYQRAHDILDDRGFYIKKEMFEELFYIKKYEKELSEGKWPRELDNLFEYTETPVDLGTELTEDAIIVRKKHILKLKAGCKPFKKDGDADPKAMPASAGADVKDAIKPDESGNGDNKKDNDKNPQ